MPLVLHKNIENGQIGLWEITEELEDLEQLARLCARDLTTYSGISALHRKKEWLATRALLNQLSFAPVLIKYFDDGRPYLENRQYNISISHTSGFVAVFVHQIFIPGIDIEHLSRQVKRVASRFLCSEEFEMCCDESELSNRKVLLHWCAKEAVFKMVPFTNIEFSIDILILLNNTSSDSGSFQAIFKHKAGQISVVLEYLETHGIILVWDVPVKSDQSQFVMLNLNN